jgi:glycosyltransferase involved in cell wall biosynthesis
MVGAMMPEKRQLECVSAVGAVPKNVRPTLICISNVASGPYAQEVAAAAQKRDVQLVMKTAVTDDVLLGWLQTAKALLYAPRLEPFGLAPIEAGATATPVVGVAEGGVRETVLDGETGLLVENTDDLGSALTQVLTDSSLATRLGARGREIATSEWDNDQASVRLELELTSLAQSSR